MSRKIRLRAILLGGIFTLLFTSLLGRIYWVQVVEADALLAKAEAMWRTGQVLLPKRGTIFDRNSKVMAEEAQAYTVAVLPRVTDANGLTHKVSRELAEILSGTDNRESISNLQEKIYNQITRKRQDGVSLYAEVEIRNEGWKISKEIADQVTDMIQRIKEENGKDPGVFLKTERARSYPGERLASHVLGYTDKDGNAVIGLEAYYDEWLRGTAGSISYGKDRKGVELPNANVNYDPAEDGKDLQLTIDMNIQFYLENTLRKVYAEYQPASLVAIAADPRTMEILGMVSLPDFNPNQYWQTTNQSDFMNRAVSHQFEPGSTFKIVPLAGAVKEGLFKADDTFQSGKIQVSSSTLHDWSNRWGEITYMEGLKRSSNVAFVKLGYEMLGASKLMEYIHSFGFGQTTGIDIAGEVPGMVRMQRPVEFATATYGQGLTATALQLTSAYAAIANGGKLMKPYVVKNIIDPQTQQAVQSFEPEMIRQVVSEDIAQQVKLLLEQTIIDAEIGTGRRAYIEEYRVAGKTGTANIVIPGERGYAKDEWVVSFTGFAPVEDPQLIITIIAERPDLQGNFQLGGSVTLPAFKEVMRESLRYMGVPSRQRNADVSILEMKNIVPELEGLNTNTAQRKLAQSSLNYVTFGEGSKIIRQYPNEGTEIGSSQQVYLITEYSYNNQVPDFSGKSLREVLEVCSLLQLQCEVEGEGYVTKQHVTTSDEHGVVVVLQLEPLRMQQQNTNSEIPEENNP